VTAKEYKDIYQQTCKNCVHKVDNCCRINPPQVIENSDGFKEVFPVVDDHSPACGQLIFADGVTDAIPEYKSEDSYQISGRGLVFKMKLPIKELPKLGEKVRIDGKTFKLTGVETSGTAPSGSPKVCLLVSDPVQGEAQ